MHSRASPSPGRSGHVNGLRSCLCSLTLSLMRRRFKQEVFFMTEQDK